MPDDVIALLTEIHELSKLLYLFEKQAATPGSDVAWIYAAAAVRDRLTWCRQRASVLDLLHPVTPDRPHPDPTCAVDVSNGSRVH